MVLPLSLCLVVSVGSKPGSGTGPLFEDSWTKPFHVVDLGEVVVLPEDLSAGFSLTDSSTVFFNWKHVLINIVVHLPYYDVSPPQKTLSF